LHQIFLSYRCLLLFVSSVFTLSRDLYYSEQPSTPSLLNVCHSPAIVETSSYQSSFVSTTDYALYRLPYYRNFFTFFFLVFSFMYRIPYQPQPNFLSAPITFFLEFHFSLSLLLFLLLSYGPHTPQITAT